MREMGFQHRVFDMLDERLLSKDELVEFLIVLFGEEVLDNVPNVHDNWKGFTNALARIVKERGRQFNPITRRMDYWIDMKRLRRAYGTGLQGLFSRTKSVR
jgi:hypothetical protein